MTQRMDVNLDNEESSVTESDFNKKCIKDLEIIKLEIIEALKKKNSRIEEKFCNVSKEIENLKSLTESLEEEAGIRESGFFNSVHKSYLTMVLNNLSLPGLRYMSLIGIHRYLWLFIHTTAFIMSSIYILDEYMKMNPVVKYTHTPIGNIPFPAVTVCTTPFIPTVDELQKIIDFSSSCYDSKYSYRFRGFPKSWEGKSETVIRGKFFNFPTMYSNVTTDKNFIQYSKNSKCYHPNFLKVFFGIQVCECFETLNISSEQIGRFDDVFVNTTTIGPDDYLEAYDSIIKCGSGNVKLSNGKVRNSCDEEFVIRRMGQKDFFPYEKYVLCTTFNSLLPRDTYIDGVSLFPMGKALAKNLSSEHRLPSSWTPDSLINYPVNLYSLPLYGLRSINFTLGINEFCNYCPDSRSTNKDKGFRVSIHSPWESPLPENTHFYQIKKDNYMTIHVKPVLKIRDQNMARLTSVERGCLFANERKLRLYKVYTETNCLIECMAFCSKDACHCVWENAPRFEKALNVCHNHPQCEDGWSWRHRKGKNCGCDCPPSCNSIDYNITTSESSDPQSSPDTLTLKVTYNNDQFAETYHHQFEYLQFTTYVLGILGLFNGFNLIFICEIVYFFTVRLWSFIKKCF